MQQLYFKNFERSKDFATFAIECRNHLLDRPSFETAGLSLNLQKPRNHGTFAVLLFFSHPLLFDLFVFSWYADTINLFGIYG
mmetsp:Transcript_7279/g.7997  ORF Transcript_7279/g.7997 Transcript_7279/m.7997 type:complete len:82 (+) Transcript_7279:489-734(+)